MKKMFRFKPARWLRHTRRYVSKNFVFLAVGVLGMICFVCGFKKDVLPQPTFPLDEEAVAAAMEKSGLPGILSESETTSWSEGQMVHAVRSPTITYSDTISSEEADANPSTRLLIASIVSNSSEITEGKRVLSTVFGQIDVPDQMTWEDWKKQIVFATLLYGGFEDEEQVYQTFADKELPCLNGDSSFQDWVAQLPGGYCLVSYRITNESSNPVEKQKASMCVNIYESKELYQRIQNRTLKPRENIKAILTNLFSDMDESEYTEYEQWTETADTPAPEWIVKKYKGHMTDSCFDTFLNNAYYQLTIKAYEKSKSLKLVRFNVIDKGDYYEFNGRLEAGDATIKLKGSAQTDEEGLVNNFTIYNSISEIL